MKVGMVGLGKLGLPVAYAIASRGLTVYGADPCIGRAPDDTSHEDGFAEAVEQAGGRMVFCSLLDVVNTTDVIFVAVQTPHGPEFEGVTPLPRERADFDYTYLIQAVKQIVRAAEALEKPITLSVISTVLPGTMRRYVEPLLPESVSLVYNPSFIAMGTTIRDFLDPEFVLLGTNEQQTRPAMVRVLQVYCEAGILDWDDEPVNAVVRSISDAELIKVAYNTFIGLKIAFANTLMEVCHKTGCDVDEVTGALKLAHRRLISPAYMDGGMGDGGGCHPRDNIALSWLASREGLSFDLFGSVMECRQAQAEWLADLLIARGANGLPIGILGTAYKPGSHITTGSAALLVKVLVENRGYPVDVWDPHVHNDIRPKDPHVFLMGCKHLEFPEWELPEGSVVIDPFRYMPDQEGVEIVRVGEAAGRRHRLPTPQGDPAALEGRAA